MRWGAALFLLFATTSPAAAQAGDDLSHFLQTYECRVVEAIREIDAHEMTKLDRFLIVSSIKAPERYVQCMLHDVDSAIYCEAASGAYYEPVRPRANANRTALAALGFKAKRGGNFYQDISLRSETPLAVARIILTALYQAYGVREGDVGIKAPFATKSTGLLQPCPPLTS